MARRDTHIDWLMIVLYLFIVFFGWMNVYAASQMESNGEFFSLSTSYGRQLLWIGISLAAAFGIMFFNSYFFSAFAYPIYGLALLFLGGVLIVGQEVSGSKSWFVITESLKFQPSEFGKFATALVMAKFMGEKSFSFGGPGSTLFHFFDLPVKLSREGFIALALFFVPAALILLENDTGSTIAFAALFLVFYREGFTGLVLVYALLAVVLLISTVLVDKFIIIGVVLGIAALLALLLRRSRGLMALAILSGIVFSGYVYGTDYLINNILQKHQRDRILVLVGKVKDPKGVEYNVNQSKIAIGSGGLVGKGYLEGTQTRYRFVPKQYTDFIFSAVGEEWGFLGASLLILAYIGLLSRIVLNAERQKSRFSRIYGYGVASILFAHISINIGMCIGLVPTIGIPLPMFSYGGSSLFSFTILIFTFIKLDSKRSAILS
ncbi:MAG: rod shape-determining protein RodA [Flavobacteriales bacterium]